LAIQLRVACPFTLTWQAGGSKYEGEWMGDKRHGRGTQWVRRDGKLRKQYTGDWVMGRKQVCAARTLEEGLGYCHLLKCVCLCLCLCVFVCVCVCVCACVCVAGGG
jgi:hypothetical protein